MIHVSAGKVELAVMIESSNGFLQCHWGDASCLHQNEIPNPALASLGSAENDEQAKPGGKRKRSFLKRLAAASGAQVRSPPPPAVRVQEAASELPADGGASERMCMLSSFARPDVHKNIYAV